MVFYPSINTLSEYFRLINRYCKNNSDLQYRALEKSSARIHGTGDFEGDDEVRSYIYLANTDILLMNPGHSSKAAAAVSAKVKLGTFLLTHSLYDAVV